jgi:cytochrome b6-f complex iron-sulfur subunit
MGPRDDELTSLDGDVGSDNGVERAESVGQYVRLHEHVEHLRADARPPQPADLTPDEAEAYRMAALFRAAAPGADEPSPRFVSALLNRLEREATPQPATPQPATPAPATPEPQTLAPLIVPQRAPRRGVSRRSLLNVGLGAAAAAAGLAVGIGIEQAQRPSATTSTPTDVRLVNASTGTWVPVAAVGAIPLGGVQRFATETIVGYVRHTNAGFSALSGVCTHMGCLLLWNGGARTFDCPCHGGRFTEDGASAPGSVVAYKPLPSLNTKVEGDQVWVLVATPISTGNSPSATSTATAPSDGTYGA